MKIEDKDFCTYFTLPLSYRRSIIATQASHMFLVSYSRIVSIPTQGLR